MVEFISRNKSELPELRFRKCGVDVSVDDHGIPHSAVARTVLYHGHGDSQTRYETRIAFSIQNGIDSTGSSV
jgi:hypothetical protein